ncbi:MAG: DNA-directed RNA polymerase subunit omega [Candidatus Theseobacter exili]|nr:DNA-directed RNA polymerase subunit omega [Candidatus Theseobacter exili]
MRPESSKVQLGQDLPYDKYEMVVLLIRRVRQLMTGSKPLIHTKLRSPLDIAMQELIEGKIAIKWQEGVEEESAPETFFTAEPSDAESEKPGIFSDNVDVPEIDSESEMQVVDQEDDETDEDLEEDADEVSEEKLEEAPEE